MYVNAISLSPKPSEAILATGELRAHPPLNLEVEKIIYVTLIVRESLGLREVRAAAR